MSDVGLVSRARPRGQPIRRRRPRSRCPIASCSADMPPAHHEPGFRDRGPLITLGNILDAIRASALRNRYVGEHGLPGICLRTDSPRPRRDTPDVTDGALGAAPVGYAMIQTVSAPCGT